MRERSTAILRLMTKEVAVGQMSVLYGEVGVDGSFLRSVWHAVCAGLWMWWLLEKPTPMGRGGSIGW